MVAGASSSQVPSNREQVASSILTCELEAPATLTCELEAPATMGRAIFADGPRKAGEWVLDDPFKPHGHPLFTPEGHCVTRAMPSDHRHHKGLMFALKCADVNFWEEGGPDAGVQRILDARIEDGTLLLEILWERSADGQSTYREQRRIGARFDAPAGAFIWTIHSRREALRDHRLVLSEWSQVKPDGRMVNYHGLGIRLPRAWAYPSDHLNGIRSGNVDSTAMDVSGTTVREVTFWGAFDGFWQPPMGSVTMRQSTGFGWYVYKDAFAYMATGPSVLNEMDVEAGKLFDERYEVEVRDLK